MALQEYLAHDFKVGDVVLMKSGGPLMTVTECRFEKVSVTFWYEGDYRDGCFYVQTLERHNKFN